MSMTDNGSIPPDSNFDFKFIVANELAAAVLLNSWWMHTIRNIPLVIFLTSCSYTQPPGSLSRIIFYLIFTHSQPTFICRDIAEITICN